jgi:hypothetical protein
MAKICFYWAVENEVVSQGNFEHTKKKKQTRNDINNFWEIIKIRIDIHIAVPFR